MNPIHFGEGATNTFTSISVTEVVIHECGHNAAADFIHNTGRYEYYQTGLQSNQPGQIYPTQENTKVIINDNTNRQTIKK